MATYVNDLRLKEIATGDESGTWGTSTNTNLELIAESMGYGTEAVANASTHTITMADGSTDGFRCTFLRLTGGGQACTVTLAPNTLSHTWVIRNTTSYALTFTQGSGANVIIAAGQAKIVTTDGAGAGAVVYECLEDLELGGTLTVGIDDTGQDVKFFGATSGKYWLWDESADGVVQQGTLTVGVDDTGYDVKLFGATSGAYMLWDESADDLKLVGAAGLTVASDVDVDGTTNLDAVDIDGAVQIDSTVTVGVDDTGYDVKFFGDTASAYMLWDTSADDLVLAGAAGIDLAGDIDVDGTANLDIVDIDGAVDMASTLTLAGNADFNGDLDVDGTTNLDAVDVDGAVNFAADVTYADGADIITASAGTSNFRAGVNAGNSIASGGNYNVAVGDEAGTAITTGDSNIFIGYSAGVATTVGVENVAIGYSALLTNVDGSGSTAVGHQALRIHDPASAVATYNTAIGYGSGYATTTAQYNVHCGAFSGYQATEGNYNVGVGYSALYATNTGVSNTGIGTSALAGNTSAGYNTAVGAYAADAITTADRNCAVGYAALTTNILSDRNTAIGAYSLYTMNVASNEDGYNTAVGEQSGYAITTGQYNTMLGSLAGDSHQTGDGNICLGYGTETSAVDAAYQFAIGYGVTATANSTVTIGVSGNTASLGLDGSDTSWAAASSDMRLKENIQASTAGLSFINDLRPVTYNWKKAGEVPTDMPQYEEGSEKPCLGYEYGMTYHGFIAQEVKEAIDKHPELEEGFKMWKEYDSGVQTVADGNVIPMLVKAVQELSAEVNSLKEGS